MVYSYIIDLAHRWYSVLTQRFIMGMGINIYPVFKTFFFLKSDSNLPSSIKQVLQPQLISRFFHRFVNLASESRITASSALNYFQPSPK